MTTVPFLSYKILPSQTIINENIRSDHIKEDLDVLIHALSPILFITKTGGPKPPFLSPSVVQNLVDKPATLSLLELFGWLPNKGGDFVFSNPSSAEETHQREAVANEFRQFYDELKKTKDHQLEIVTENFPIITTVLFSTYQIIPAESIVRANVRHDRIKEDLDALIHALTPILYMTKSGVPKPPFLDPTTIEQLENKPGTLNLLSLFGCIPNHRGEYAFVDAKNSDELRSYEAAANEFRRFYDELKKVKQGNPFAMEYFLDHPNPQRSSTV